MRNLSLSLIVLLLTFRLAAQPGSTADTIDKQVLDEVIVSAYAANRSLQEIPAAVNIISPQQLNRFGNTSLLPAINATPGVRMEERSPGSYRLSVRGSALRSPFGVRNVKVYYNGIPFTDPGGFTYFNQLGFYNVQSLEIIKGPGSSMYGAGTGGVMLIESMKPDWKPGIRAGYTGGSFGLNNLHTELNIGRQGFKNTIRYQHIGSNGYREHTNMQRDVLSWDALVYSPGKNLLSAHVLYSNLYYQTPGALTKTMYDTAPRAARPAAGMFPGAVQAKAAVYGQTFLSGITNQYDFSEGFSNTTSLYGVYTLLNNPTVQNYGSSSEPHFGGRTMFRGYTSQGASGFEWFLGGELQQGFSFTKTYKNLNGNPDTLLLDDEVNNRQYFVFAQLSWLWRKWVVTAGASLNKQRFVFARLNNYPYREYSRDFDNQLAPRAAALYQLNRAVSFYINIAKGFSPPTTAELLPSGLNLNAALQAEYGWNYEMGSRGGFGNSRFTYDISVFRFDLNHAIVVRRDAGGGNFFTNAGGTMQAGLESRLAYNVVRNNTTFLRSVNLWASYSYYHFRYNEFIQDGNDFSGNPLPGVAPHTVTTGIDINAGKFYANITYNYTDAIPLNDASLAVADAYHLLGARAGYRRSFKRKYSFDLFAGGDNLLDTKYSLGNDINGFGGRYYNAAPGINFYVGILLGYNR